MENVKEKLDSIETDIKKLEMEEVKLLSRKEQAEKEVGEKREDLVLLGITQIETTEKIKQIKEKLEVTINKGVKEIQELIKKVWEI